MKETVGDHYNTACPHCGKVNHYIADKIRITLGRITELFKQCEHCKKVICYHLQYEIKVTAYSEDPVENKQLPSS